MRKLAKVSRSGYYAYIKRLSSPSDKELKDKEDYYSIKIFRLCRGNCWDNAPLESFYALLKTEMNLKDYKTYEQVAIGIMDYMNYYNYDRVLGQLNKLTPSEYDEYLTFPNYNHKYLPMVLNH